MLGYTFYKFEGEGSIGSVDLTINLSNVIYYKIEIVDEEVGILISTSSNNTIFIRCSSREVAEERVRDLEDLILINQ